MKSKKWILPVIVISQFCCTSTWFAGNAVIKELVIDFHLTETALANLTSAVQFGFISGTLIYALLTIADRFSPSFVFFISALAAAFSNLSVLIEGQGINSLLLLRFLTGFFLAGIYPVGMKIAADHYEKGLGKALGFLVGALVIGTSFPHLLRSIVSNMPWKIVLICTSVLCPLGGSLMLLLVPNGPFRKKSAKFDATALFKVFRDQKFRSASFGYFGHMWELYTFWAFVPFILTNWQKMNPGNELNIPALSFLIIAAGGLACAISGWFSQKLGAKKMAGSFLFLSASCCLISPFIFSVSSIGVLLGFMIFWGMVVIADSPLFSTLVAQNAPAESKGTALTIVNCIGFGITIISIQLINLLLPSINTQYIFMLLAIGPVLGLLALFNRPKNK